MKRSQDVDEAPELSREQVRTVITGACILGDTTLDAHIDDLWAAKSDPDRMRHLLDRFHCEVEAARTLLAAAGGPEWWSTVDADRLAAACVAARTWAEGDPTCAELERGFASRLLTVFGVDLAGIPSVRSLSASSGL